MNELQTINSFDGGGLKGLNFVEFKLNKGGQGQQLICSLSKRGGGAETLNKATCEIYLARSSKTANKNNLLKI